MYVRGPGLPRGGPGRCRPGWGGAGRGGVGRAGAGRDRGAVGRAEAVWAGPGRAEAGPRSFITRARAAFLTRTDLKRGRSGPGKSARFLPWVTAGFQGFLLGSAEEGHACAPSAARDGRCLGWERVRAAEPFTARILRWERKGPSLECGRKPG